MGHLSQVILPCGTDGCIWHMKGYILIGSSSSFDSLCIQLCTSICRTVLHFKVSVQKSEDTQGVRWGYFSEFIDFFLYIYVYVIYMKFEQRYIFPLILDDFILK